MDFSHLQFSKGSMCKLTANEIYLVRAAYLIEELSLPMNKFVYTGKNSNTMNKSSVNFFHQSFPLIAQSPNHDMQNITKNVILSLENQIPDFPLKKEEKYRNWNFRFLSASTPY